MGATEAPAEDPVEMAIGHAAQVAAHLPGLAAVERLLAEASVELARLRSAASTLPAEAPAGALRLLEEQVLQASIQVSMLTTPLRAATRHLKRGVTGEDAERKIFEAVLLADLTDAGVTAAERGRIAARLSGDRGAPESVRRKHYQRVRDHEQRAVAAQAEIEAALHGALDENQRWIDDFKRTAPPEHHALVDEVGAARAGELRRHYLGRRGKDSAR